MSAERAIGLTSQTGGSRLAYDAKTTGAFSNFSRKVL
jgi:hypothetical protein